MLLPTRSPALFMKAGVTVNPLKLLRLFELYERLQSVLKGKASMQVKLAQILALVGTLSATIGLPSLLSNWVHAHQSVYLAIVSAALVLHAVMPSIFAAPSSDDVAKSGLDVNTVGKLGAVLILGAIAASASAQVAPAAGNPPVQNLYAAGASWSINASPAVAGTALYAHNLAGNTYAFTAIDAVPASYQPFTVTSNIGVGVAQRAAVVHGVSFYIPTAAGVSWSGSATGWQWNGGIAAAIPFKGFYIMPTARFLKSSISNGSGYQPIVGLLFGWGK